MEYDWWNAIKTYKKLPTVHVVQWLGMFWLDLGRCFHGTWWNISCLAGVLWVKEWEKKALTLKWYKKLNATRLSWRPQTITLAIFILSVKPSNAVIAARYPNDLIWLVRDTYPYVAIWLVRDSNIFMRQSDTYPNAKIW